MGGEHQAVKTMKNKKRTLKTDVRRRSPTWDRMKFIVLILFALGILISSKVSAPFTTLEQALADTWNETFGRVLMIALPLELLRQIHYYISEKVGPYNRFWAKGVFGGMERQAHRRFKPWTRFRLGRYVRILIFLLILGAVVDYFVADVNSPVEALIQLPRILARNFQQFIFFLFYPLFLILQFGALFWFLSRGGVDTVMPEEIETRYSDVWGQDHVLDLVRENVGFLEKPDEIEAKGGYIPGGILLWGPPGTGKTLIAEATAGEVGLPFVFVEPGAFINMFFGVGILKVKGLFRKLRKMALRHGGVVVFFDEADALGSRGAIAQGGGPPQPASPLPFGMHCNGSSYLSPQALSIIHEQYSHTNQAPATEQPEDRPGSLINRIIMGGGGGRRRNGHPPSPTYRDLRPEEAPRDHQQGPQDAGYEAQAPAQVPNLHHDGHQPAQRAGPGVASARPHRPHLQGRLPHQGRTGCAPSRVIWPRSPTTSPKSRSTSWPPRPPTTRVPRSRTW